MNLHLRHTKTVACTRDIISNAPAVNTINRRVFLPVLYYILNFIIHANIYTVPLNYNFISTRVYTRGTTQFHACKMLKSCVEIIIYTRRVRVIYTRRGMPRHDTAWYYTRRGYCFYIHRPPAEIDRNQLLGVWLHR